jgi:nitrogen fixation protein FixH
MASAFAPPARAASRGRWIPWLFVAGMLLVVAVNATLVYFATRSWGGLVSDRAFERGIAYNRLIAEAAAEAALGWTAEIAYQAGANGKTPVLLVTLRDGAGEPMDRAAVSLEAARPVEAQAPVAVGLRPVGDGRYAGAADGLRAGQWDIRMAVARDGHDAHFTRRIVVR